MLRAVRRQQMGRARLPRTPSFKGQSCGASANAFAGGSGLEAGGRGPARRVTDAAPSTNNFC